LTSEACSNYRNKAQLTIRCTATDNCYCGLAYKACASNFQDPVRFSDFLGELRCPACSQLQVFDLEVRCAGCGKLSTPICATSEEELHDQVRRIIAHDFSLERVFHNPPTAAFLDVPSEAQVLCQRLWDEVLDREVLEAMGSSLTAPSGALRLRLQQKMASARQPQNAHLRVLVVDAARFQSLAAVLEVWPQGHFSTRHQHGGSAGAIKVLAGKLRLDLFHSIDSEEPLAAGQLLSAGDVTWLDRRNFFCHQMSFEEAEAEVPGLAVALHLYKDRTHEYEFVESEGRIARSEAPVDFVWRRQLAGPNRERVAQSAEGAADFQTAVLSRSG